jgi:hypothetical protein
LTRTIEDDRCPASPRIRTPKAILAKFDPSSRASHFRQHGPTIAAAWLCWLGNGDTTVEIANATRPVPIATYL